MLEVSRSVAFVRATTPFLLLWALEEGLSKTKPAGHWALENDVTHRHHCAHEEDVVRTKGDPRTSLPEGGVCGGNFFFF